MTELKQIYCILCPNACAMAVSVDSENKSIVTVSNNRCNRGPKYAAQEILLPKRTLITTIPIDSQDWPVVSVRTATAIPKERMFDVYNEIKRCHLAAPVTIGDVVIKDVLGLGTDVVVTRTIR